MTSILSSGIIEVAIGLAFVYLLLSLLCSVINEWIAGILASRANNLEKGIQSLFTGGTLDGKLPFAKAIYDHGLIQSLYNQGRWDKFLERFGRKTGPSYIAPDLFASTLVNLLIPSPDPGENPLVALRQKIAGLPDSKGKQALVALVNQGQADLEQVRQTLESWYNDGMDRVAGWYKRRTTLVLFFLGLIAAIGTNTDSFLIAQMLWNNPALRQATVTAADNYVQSHTKPETGTAGTAGTATTTSADVKTAITQVTADLQSMQLPVGWPTQTGPMLAGVGSAFQTLFSDVHDGSQPADPRAFPSTTRVAWFRVFGWLFTAAALSLGAPFWFDVLNKFMVVRSTVKPKEKSQVEGSKD